MVKHSAPRPVEPVTDPDENDTMLPDAPYEPDDFPGPAPDPSPEPPEPLSASRFDQQSQPTWVGSYTAATDNPLHPLHHLKGA